MMPADRNKTWYDDPKDHYKCWNDFINAFFDETAARYGTDIDSYYIDMISDPDYLERIDAKRIRNTLLKYAPDTPIVGNGNAEEAVDYGSKEDGAFDVSDIDFRVTYASQSVVYQSRCWWATVPSNGCRASKYTPVKTGQWKSTGEKKTALFMPVKARFVKLEACPGWNFMYGDTCHAAAGICIGTFGGD